MKMKMESVDPVTFEIPPLCRLQAITTPMNKSMTPWKIQTLNVTNRGRLTSETTTANLIRPIQPRPWWPPKAGPTTYRQLWVIPIGSTRVPVTKRPQRASPGLHTVMTTDIQQPP